jgi:hypothetical protein
MRKRTRITVVAAALLLALVGPSVTGAAGNDGVVVAGAISTSWIQRWARFLGIAVGRSDDMVSRAVQGRLDSVIKPVVYTPAGDLLIPTQRQRARLYQVACRTQFTVELLREQEIKNQLWALSTEIPGALGYTMWVANLTRELVKAKDNGDRAYKAGNALFCAAAEANLKRFR